ncbi:MULTISPECIES: DUF1365 domain-containing protein [Asticcacaulis]|uniref:DUF1365 domain-containing protein n=1 Tax=Asticcacaulis TaxID=76890 RepID=UPI001AE9922D|nr:MULTISPECIES: DUF1365 domain-containing protein [Asticcacaulis]MBP2159815.1 DUF1365 family protein [Asticcacaulis solisilvae]MDR6800860.1 DUF1365 family protein [Asticcacaulis sp. BE141]
MEPGLYIGEVIHQRFAPRPHRLNYNIFQILVDLDHVPETHFLGYNRFNLFSFYERDHGPVQGEKGSLNDRMAAMLREKGLYAQGDRIWLLTMPRVLGFVFNPISLYFPQGADGRLKAVVYEVNNTFGDRHSYVLPVITDTRHIRQHSNKRLHVSPFMDTRDMAYDFDLTAPGETFALKIRLRHHAAEGVRDMLFAGFTAKRTPITDEALWKLFWAMPLMTLKVVAGIHWEALKIALKGIRLRPKPPTEKSSVSF